MCIICETPYEELKNVSNIHCFRCKNLKSIPDFLNADLVYINGCPNLETFETNLPRLKFLECWDCPKLQKIDVKKASSLRTIKCYFLNNLRIISGDISNIREICISSCAKLEKVGDIKSSSSSSSSYFSCDRCISLREIGVEKFSALSVNFNACPFLEHLQINPKCSKNFRNFSILQQKVKKYIRYRRFVKFINSKAFIEWIYAPERIGGKLAKRSIENIIAN
jgi:hypothetical protein